MSKSGGAGNTAWDKIYAAGGFDKEPEPELLALCKNSPRGKALDVGAGEGRHALWLAAHGWGLR